MNVEWKPGSKNVYLSMRVHRKISAIDQPELRDTDEWSILIGADDWCCCLLALLIVRGDRNV